MTRNFYYKIKLIKHQKHLLNHKIEYIKLSVKGIKWDITADHRAMKSTV